MSDSPRRRSDRIIVRRVDDEVVIYDLDTDRVTHLDTVSADVWQACTGDRDVASIASGLRRTRAEVESALVRLADAGLMVEAGLSRRQLLARAGAVAWVVPLVSIAAPAAAAAASRAPGVQITGVCRSAHVSPVVITITGSPGSSVGVQWFGDLNGSQNVTVGADGTVQIPITTPTTGKPQAYTLTAIADFGQGIVVQVTETASCQ